MMKNNQAGFTLISVMIAMLIFFFGLLGLAGLYARTVPAVTQNQNIEVIASQGNGFWGIVQANPLILAALSANPTYTSANYGAAPVALQNWLQLILLPNSYAYLPNGSVQITTGNDPQGNACSTTSCSVTLSIKWDVIGNTQNASAQRTQTFSYQFGV